VPLKKSEPITYQAKEVSVSGRLLAEFRGAKGLKAKTLCATEAIKCFPDLEDKAAVAAELIAALNADIASHQRTQPGVALEGIFARDDLRQAAGLAAPAESELTSWGIWTPEVRLSTILETVPVAKHQRVLQTFKAVNPNLWHEALLTTINGVPSKIVGECVDILIEEGKLQPLKDTFAALISRHTANSELLLWLAR
jgi:hypothetical protein